MTRPTRYHAEIRVLRDRLITAREEILVLAMAAAALEDRGARLDIASELSEAGKALELAVTKLTREA